MKRTIAALLITGGCAGSTSEWGWAPQDILQAPSQSDYHEKPAVYLLKNVQVRLVSRWRDDSFTQFHHHQVVAILNEKGFHKADVRIPYQAKGKFVKFEARTISPDGAITEVAPERVYDDELTKSEEEDGWNYKARVFSFPEVKVGSILEHHYILEVPSFYASITEYLNDELPVKRYRFSITGTDDVAYKIKAYNTSAPFQTDEGGEGWTITWSLDDVPASVDEGFRLGRAYLDPWIAFSVTKRSKFSYSHDYYTNWDHGLWWKGRELYFENDEYYEKFEPQVDFSGCSDKTCRIQRAIDHLTREYPFRGFGGYPGRKAKEATDARRASAFEKNRLLWKILAHQGITAKFAFVNRYLTSYLDKEHASWNAGNHLLLRIDPQEGVPEPIWVDASCEYCKVGEIPAWLKDSEAMVVHASRTPPSLEVETKAEMAKISGTPNNDEGAVHDIRLDVDATGGAKVGIDFVYRGRLCMDEKNDNLETTAEQWKKDAEKRMKTRFASGSLVSWEPMQIEAGICTQRIAFNAPAYSSLDEGRLLVPLTLFKSKWDKTLRNDKKRTLQIAFARPENTTEVISIPIPEGFEMLRLPQNRVATAKGISVSVDAMQEGNTVKVTRRVKIHPGLYHQKNYPQIVAALDAFSAVRQDVIEFGPKASAPLTGVTSSEPGEKPQK